MAPQTSFVVSALAFLGGLVQPCQGNAFLRKQDMPSPALQFLNQSAIEARFLKEVRGFVGKEQMDAQLPAIKAALEPMWKALPKNADGRLDNGQVKYALHRYFVQRHGWHIDGLDRTDTDGTKSNGGVARQEVPMFMIELFREAFGQSGLMLHELALFAATLEHMIHDEATDRLKDVYKAMSLSTGQPLSQEQVDEASRAYMMSLLLGQDKLNGAQPLEMLFYKLERTYPGWSDTQLWLKEVRENVSYLERGAENPIEAQAGYSFQQVENIVDAVSNRLGAFQDKECRQLKDLLLEEEDGGSGRVRLSDFYKKGMATDMQFVEKPEYLRQLGALDESLPGEPRVIVPNYILSQGNCLSDMGFYSICCTNECESLVSHLERVLAAPEGSPEQIARVVGSYSTSSTEAPAQFSESMLRRLNEVAQRNGGQVPLHSRLFAQWLHFAFPRECPFPQVAGSTNPLTPAEWLELNEAKPNMKLNDMKDYVRSAAAYSASVEDSGEVTASSADEEALLTRWSEEEEILYVPAKAPSSTSGVWRALFSLAMIGGVCVMVVDRAKRSGGLVTLGIKEKAHMV